MDSGQTVPDTNNLIADLPTRQQARLLQACKPTEMATGDVLCEVGQPYRNAYFPFSALITQVSAIDGHQPLEMGLIGREGMLGATLLLGIDEAPMRAVVQGPGNAMRIPVARLRREVRDGSGLRKVLGRYLYLRLVELSLAATCTRFHQIDQRLARLLLLTHDRTRTAHFELTHQTLSDMLGVRRSGVTVAAGTLQTNGVIDYSRGEITILDRPALEAASCECYWMLNRRRNLIRAGRSR